jgi:lipopolysaccharide transport system permease protein
MTQSDASGGPQPRLVITPPKRFATVNFREVIEFRDLLARFAIRDLKLRYRQTALGVLWVVLQPLMTAGVFSFLFGKVANFPSDGVPYFAFSFAGMLAWNVFSGALGKVSTSLVANTQLVSKIFFPRFVLPLSMLSSTLVDFGVALVLMALICVIVGIWGGWALLTLPLWLLLVILLSLGLGLMAAALMVSYRDVAYILPVVTQVLLYGSPVAYGVNALPRSVRTWFQLNPLTGALEGFRWSILGTSRPAWWAIIWSATLALLLFGAGVSVFATMERKFADVI